MKKTNIFIILFVTTIISLLILFTFMINNYPTSIYPDWMSEMWSHMGGEMVENPNDPYLGYFGVLFTVLIAIVIISVAGLIYFLLFPELKRSQTKSQIKQQESSKKRSPFTEVTYLCEFFSTRPKSKSKPKYFLAET